MLLNKKSQKQLLTQKELLKLLKGGCGICDRKDPFWFIPVISVFCEYPVGYICGHCGSSYGDRVELIEPHFNSYNELGIA